MTNKKSNPKINTFTDTNPVQIVIPDDYQHATDNIRLLHNDPRLKVTSLGDISIKNASQNENDILKQAEALILIRERTQINADFLKRVPKLRLISQTGKVARNIDLELCRQHGIDVVEGSGSPIAPAELTWLMIQAGMRQFVPAVNGMKKGDWQINIGETLFGKTIGILGFGKIGKRIAKYAQAFDMKVQVWGSDRALVEARDMDFIVPNSREDFFATSDIITLHQRLVPSLVGNITLADLTKMKESALFVNTSRAELVMPGAIEQALTVGRPRFFALDVYEKEPIYDSNHPLLSHDRVLCSPHIGYVEKGSYELYFQIAIDNIRCYFDGYRDHVINYK